jgi:hypothetical protein
MKKYNYWVNKDLEVNFYEDEKDGYIYFEDEIKELLEENKRLKQLENNKQKEEN